MAIELAPALPLDVSPVSAVFSPFSSTDDQRWEAWRAKGAAHDRAFRRKLSFMVPAVVFAAALFYALIIR